MLKTIAIDAGNSLADIRLTEACLLAISSFLRYDKVSNILYVHVMSNLTLPSQSPEEKNDQLHQGNEVVIARSNSITCPVAMLERYPKWVISFSTNCCWPDSQALWLWKVVLHQDEWAVETEVGWVGLPISGVHPTQSPSWRRNSCCRGRCSRPHFQETWPMEVRKCYVKDSLEKWLLVSKSLGLWHVCVCILGPTCMHANLFHCSLLLSIQCWQLISW